MPKVYVVGHGWITNAIITLPQGVHVHTFTPDDTMLDARGTPDILRNGQYAMDASHQHQLTQHWMPEDMINEHLVASDSGSLLDLNTYKPWTERSPKGPDDMSKGGGNGKVNWFVNPGDGDAMAYTTEPGNLTFLSYVIRNIRLRDNNGELHIYWCACRSYVENGTDDELMEYINAGDNCSVNRVSR